MQFHRWTYAVLTLAVFRFDKHHWCSEMWHAQEYHWMHIWFAMASTLRAARCLTKKCWLQFFYLLVFPEASCGVGMSIWLREINFKGDRVQYSRMWSLKQLEGLYRLWIHKLLSSWFYCRTKCEKWEARRWRTTFNQLGFRSWTENFISNAFKGKERVTKEANSSSGYKFGRRFPMSFVQCLWMSCRYENRSSKLKLVDINFSGTWVYSWILHWPLKDLSGL